MYTVQSLIINTYTESRAFTDVLEQKDFEMDYDVLFKYNGNIRDNQIKTDTTRLKFVDELYRKIDLKYRCFGHSLVLQFETKKEVTAFLKGFFSGETDRGLRNGNYHYAFVYEFK